MDFYYTVDADHMPPNDVPDVPILLTASSFFQSTRYGKGGGFGPAPKLPAHLTKIAADCGGFVATFRWGDYRYTPEGYNAWLERWTPEWAATMDYCCEDEITTGKAGVVRDRQDRTTEMAHRFWLEYRDAPWAWVPTVQGWRVPEDYERHAEELTPLVAEMRSHYEATGRGEAFRVGIGTLCRRASTTEVHQVARAVSAILPNTPIHLWGIKLGALKSVLALPTSVASVDSAAWNYGVYQKPYIGMGITQRKWYFDVALPAYRSKVSDALTRPKQLTLID